MSNPVLNSLLKKREPQLFPCSACHGACEVKTTKKGKPYLICDSCGVQLFVRGKAGIERFEKLLAELERNNIWKRLAELERRYRFECPKCGKKFWPEPELIRTKWPSKKAIGYRCPEPGCGGIVNVEDASTGASSPEKEA